MRIFNELVFNNYVSGTADVFSDPKFDDLLGYVDQLSIGGYTAQVSVSSGTPNLTVQIQQSFDRFRWQSRNVTPEVNAQTISTGATETIVHGKDAAPGQRPPRLAYTRIRVALGVTAGSNPAAQVRIWAIGRDCKRG